MFRIAVCDDELEMCNMLGKMLSGYSDLPVFAVDLYQSGEELCRVVQAGKHYDLYILDIDLKTVTGIQVGNMLRERLQQGMAQILFISARSSYAMALFDLRPLNFLIKPIQPQKLHDCVEVAMAISRENAPYFRYTHRKQLYRVPCRRIRYFESANKNLYIHTVDAVQEVTMQLSEVLRQKPPLPDSFFQIHQSYVVNYDYIKRAGYAKILLDSGVELPISYTYRKEVKERVFALTAAAGGDGR